MRRILCFGDSNTWGLIAGTTRRYDWNTRWTGRLQAALGPKIQVIEEGLCGRTTVFPDSRRPGRAGSALLPVLLESHWPLDLLVLMLGTNDCKTANGLSAPAICAGLETLLDQVQQTCPGCPVLVLSPIALGDGVWELDPEFEPRSVALSRALPGLFRRIALRRGALFLAASDCAQPDPADGEHLSREGHARLAAAVAGAVQALLCEEAV